MTRAFRNAIISFAFLPVIALIAVFNRLPGRVAMEWSARGEPVWYAPKLAFALAILIAPLAAALLLYGDVGNIPRLRQKPHWPWLALAIVAVLGLALTGAVIANLPR